MCWQSQSNFVNNVRPDYVHYNEYMLIYWGWVTYINWYIIIWNDNLSSVQFRAIIWTNANFLLIGQFGTNIDENWVYFCGSYFVSASMY